MKRASKIALAIIAATASGSTFAGSDSGIYVGGSIGTAALDYKISDGGDTLKFDDDDTGYKIFAGYNFGLVPMVNIAAEVAYIDFGSQEGKINNITGNKLEANGMTLSGLVGVDMGPVGLFAKAGYFSWDADVKTIVGNDSDSGSDPAYGLGAKFQLGSIALRAEYEAFQLDDADIDYFSVGASYTF